ncbi:MAG: hypothetical protein PF518_07755 [Spirochaetaceae bacterium]|nr:hypothetical protein [Spirochaetaceae bacterium]
MQKTIKKHPSREASIFHHNDTDGLSSETILLNAFAKINYDISRESYSHLGILGAVGDGFLVDGTLSGVNRDILKTAVKQKLVRVDELLFDEIYYIMLGGKEYPAADICSTLDTLGGVGYYDGGATRGIHICQRGIDSKTARYIEDLKSKKEDLFEKEIENLKKNKYR